MEVIVNKNGVTINGNLTLNEIQEDILESIQQLIKSKEEERVLLKEIRIKKLREEYEVRKGHKVSCSYDFLEDDFKFIICKKGFYSINKVMITLLRPGEVVGGIEDKLKVTLMVNLNIDTLEPTPIQQPLELNELTWDATILGWGRTEDEAWDYYLGIDNE